MSRPSSGLKKRVHEARDQHEAIRHYNAEDRNLINHLLCKDCSNRQTRLYYSQYSKEYAMWRWLVMSRSPFLRKNVWESLLVITCVTGKAQVLSREFHYRPKLCDCNSAMLQWRFVESQLQVLKSSGTLHRLKVSYIYIYFGGMDSVYRFVLEGSTC
jgi:hypothetical protein